MKRLLPALALTLAFAAPASAKEIVAISVCGTNGCHSTRDRSDLRQAMNVQPQASPDHGGPFYRMRSTIGEPGQKQEFVQRSQWIPSLRLIRNDDGPLIEFSLPYPAAERTLRRLSAGLRPFTAAKLGPITGSAHAAKVDEVVPAPTTTSSDAGGDGGGSGWVWSLLAIAPAGIAFWLLRRRRGRPSLA
jgi:hypothetical protein